MLAPLQLLLPTQNRPLVEWLARAATNQFTACQPLRSQRLFGQNDGAMMGHSGSGELGRLLHLLDTAKVEHHLHK